MAKRPNEFSSWLISETELSPKSTKIVQLAKLLDKKYRRKSSKFLVEGDNAVQACAKNHKLLELFATRNYLDKSDRIKEIIEFSNCKINLVDEKALRKITETESPAGIVALSASITKSLSIEDLSNKTFIIVLFDVSDPGNAGTIIRTADGFGADLIVFAGQTVDITNGKTIRASAGSVFNVDIATCKVSELARFLDNSTFNIYQTNAKTELSISEVDLTKPIVWIFGNETHGLNDFQEKLGVEVSIPMPGNTESFNLATAATLCMYETAKARSIK